MTEQEPPCYVQAWAKAHETEVFWDKAGDGPSSPVPAHDSDAWLAGIIKASLHRGRHLAFDEDFQGVAAIKFCVTSNLEQAFARTLHAALCRAVWQGEHQC